MKQIYFLTQEQIIALQAVNTQLATFVPCWYKTENTEGVAIETTTFSSAEFIAHKNVFDSFDPQPSLVDYDNNTDF